MQTATKKTDGNDSRDAVLARQPLLQRMAASAPDAASGASAAA